MLYVTRRVHFNAAHRMHNPEWSAEKNAAVFGKCNNVNWHGHNYELEVTLVGTPNPETGYVADLGTLATLLEEHLLEKVDHKNLNLDVDFMQGIIPSSENFAIQIWNLLEPLVKPARLYSVKLYETPRNYVEYRGSHHQPH